MLDSRATQTQELLKMPRVEFELNRAKLALFLANKFHARNIFVECFFTPVTSQDIVDNHRKRHALYKQQKKLETRKKYSELSVGNLEMYRRTVNDKAGKKDELIKKFPQKGKRKKLFFVDLSKQPFSFVGFADLFNKKLKELKSLEIKTGLKPSKVEKHFVQKNIFDKPIYWNTFFRVYTTKMAMAFRGKTLEELEQTLFEKLSDKNEAHNFLVEFSQAKSLPVNKQLAKYVLKTVKIPQERFVLKSEKEQRKEFEKWIINGI